MSIFKFVVTILFVALIAVGSAGATCSNATLNGVYGYYHGRPDGVSGQRAVVGQMIADGKGNLIGSWTMSLNGTVTTGSFTGTYSISKNCTGSFTLSNEDQSPANFSIILDDSHKGFQILQTDNGTAQPGFGVEQGKGTCGLSGKKRTFATNFLGVLTSIPAVDAIVGQVILDGKGNITGNETFSVLGTISAVPVTGTYTENADCTGTVQITPQGSAATNFNMVVVNGGKELLVVETDNDTVVAGTAQE